MEYTYLITEFKSADVRLTDLQTQIKAVLPSVSFCRQLGTDIIITFPAEINKTILDGVIASYVFRAIAPSVSATYDTVVSNNPDKLGDYTSIATAFASGAKSVYVRNGTYIESSNIIIPDGGQLLGEAIGKTVIVLVAGASIKVDGSSGNVQTAGTISISTESKTLTGTGTTFTALNAGDFIRIVSCYYQIASITSDTQLTLANTYHGTTLTNMSYKAQHMHTGIIIANLVITGSSNSGIYARAIRHGSIKSVGLLQCATNLNIIDSGNIACHEIISAFSGTSGIVLDGCSAISLYTVNVLNNGTNGLEFKGDCDDIYLVNGVSQSNVQAGYKLSANDVILTNCLSKCNGTNGFEGDVNTYGTVLKGCDAERNGGYGISILGSYTDVANCRIDNNTNGIHVGTNSKITSVHIAESTIGLQVGNHSIISSCNIHDTTTGVIVGDDCVVSGNILNNMTVGTSNIITGNNLNALTSNGDNIITSNVFKSSNLVQVSGQSVIASNIGV